MMLLRGLRVCLEAQTKDLDKEEQKMMRSLRKTDQVILTTRAIQATLPK